MANPAVDPIPQVDGRPHPDDDTLRLFTSFTGFVRSWKMDSTTGDAIMVIAVPSANKHEAFKLSDHMGLRFVMDVYTAPRRTVWADGREHDAQEKLDEEHADPTDSTDSWQTT